MSNKILVAGFAATLGVTSLFAVPAFASDTTPPAVADPDVQSNTSAAPVAGENSFTQEQAVKRLESAGYKDVAALKQDEHGVWRGTAMKGADTVRVSVDYQGNVTTD